jgi:hypothetical protein
MTRARDLASNILPGNWTAYTPTFTNFTLGNGTIAFAYSQIGKTIHVRGYILLGSTSVVSGSVLMTLPINAQSASGQPIVGHAKMSDSGTASYGANVILNSGAAFAFVVANVSGTYPQIGGISSTVPFTWTTNDDLTFQATYQGV